MTNDGDEERVREVAEAAAEAVAAAGMDAATGRSSLGSTTEETEAKRTVLPPGPRGPPPARAQIGAMGRSPRPSADNTRDNRAAGRPFPPRGDPPLDPAVAKIPVPGGRGGRTSPTPWEEPNLAVDRATLRFESERPRCGPRAGCVTGDASPTCACSTRSRWSGRQ